MSATDEVTPLDVWLLFDAPEDEESSHEANTFRTTDGYRVEWYHTAVGQVTPVYFRTLAEVHAWYEANGYQDFSS